MNSKNFPFRIPPIVNLDEGTITEMVCSQPAMCGSLPCTCGDNKHMQTRKLYPMETDLYAPKFKW